MALEFAGVDRGQLLLMPPSLTERLPEDHLVWSVLGAVDQMNPDRFSAGVSAGCCGSATSSRHARSIPREDLIPRRIRLER
jgi:hypothetical protein